MPKKQPPKVIPLPPMPLDKTTTEYYHSKVVVFEFESREALADRDWKRLRALFLDFGTFVQRHPRATQTGNSQIEPLSDK